jgi:glucose/arabinose dehydrogenase
MGSYRSTKAGLLLIALAAPQLPAAHAAIVINPVPAPIAPGIKVGLTRFAQAQSTLVAGRDPIRTRLQSLKPVPDASGRIFVHDTRGTIDVIGPAGGTPQTWFDIRAVVPGFSDASGPSQNGLMSFAFHPNFADDPGKAGYGVFYTIDTSLASGTATLVGKGPSIHHDNIIHEFRVGDPGAATAAIIGQREVLRMAQPRGDHGAGTIAFNPGAASGSADYGKLYISQGDGGGVGDPSGNAQDLASPFGKILRIDPAIGPDGEAYTIPADNPHTGETGVLGEIWASGLRNPQSFSWDRASGQMLIIDIGQSQLEEVNVGVAGSNYGWPLREGSFARGASADPNVYTDPANDGSFINPVAQYDHEEIFRGGLYNLAAIGGAIVYNGSAVPELLGKTIVSDLVSGRLFYFDSVLGNQPPLLELGLQLDGVDTSLRLLDGNPRAAGRVDLRLGTDANNEIYLLSKTFGNVYQLESLAAVPELGSWALLIAGFGLVGAVQRRRRLAAA